jgi:UDP-glucose 4-epimerase
MKILITGGAGYIGSFIVEELVGRGYEAIVFDISVKDSIKKDNVKYIRGDIFDTRSVEDVLAECDAVIHVVGLPHVQKAQKNPMLSFKLNVESVQYVLEAMRRNDVKKIVLPSSAAVYGSIEKIPVKEDYELKPNTIYGHHKLIAEEITKSYRENYGIKYTILRLFNVYGGPQSQGVLNIFIEKAKLGEPIIIYGGNQLRDFVYVKDVAKILVDSLKNEDAKNEIINVGSGKGKTINEVAEIVKEFFSNLEIIGEEPSEKEYDSVADITKLKRIYGFTPDSSPETFKKVVKWLIEYDVSY